MTTETKRDYDRYIAKAFDELAKCREWGEQPYDIDKILKKQSNKRILEKIGELAEQLELEFSDDDERIKKNRKQIDEESLKEYGFPVQTPPMSIVTFDKLLGDMFWYDIEMYHEKYTTIYKHICERIQASKNHQYIHRLKSDELDVVYCEIPSDRLWNATMGTENIFDLVHEFKVNI